jgi:predicted DNA-binding transcriptional regulator YafY
VTERAARRYIAILREAGIPVESTRGPYGGYRLGRGIRLPPLVFSTAEALGLVMAVLDGSHAAADAGDPVGAALGKIIRALPENVARPAATMRRHACAAPDRGAARPGTETTSALIAAVAAQHRVSIGYRSESGRRWEEDVDPWAVVVRHGRWYLLCHSHRAGAVRAYRIDRIQSAAAGGGQFRPPGDLDYVDLLEQHLGTGWEFETRVSFDAPYDEAARHVRPPMGRLERTGDGKRCVLIGTTSNPADVCRGVAGRDPDPLPCRRRPRASRCRRSCRRPADGRPGGTAGQRAFTADEITSRIERCSLDHGRGPCRRPGLPQADFRADRPAVSGDHRNASSSA